jgi:two-component sensor histidine kinase
VEKEGIILGELVSSFLFFYYHYIIFCEIVKYLYFNIFLLLLLFYSTPLFSQKNELDNLYYSVKEIKNIQDYNKFKAFHAQFDKLSSVIENDISNPKYAKLYDKALVWAKKQKDKSFFLETKYFSLNYYYKTSKYDKFLTIAYELYQDDDFKKNKNIVPTLVLLSHYYNQTEQFTELLNLYPILYKQIKKHNIQLSYITKGRKNEEIGLVYFRLRDFKTSRYHFKLSKQAYSENFNYFKTSGAENNIGLTFLREGKIDSANYYFDKALKIIQKVNFKDPKVQGFIPVIYGNKASILVQQQKYDKALPFFLEELKKNKIKGLDYNTVRAAYLKLADLYYKKSDIKTSLKYIDSVSLILKKYPSSYIQQNYYGLKAKCLLVNNNISLANEYFDKLKKYSDSIKSTRVKQRYLLATVKYETKRKEQELILTKQKIALQKKTNNYQKIALLLLSIISIGLFFFLQKIISDKKKINNQKNKTQQALEKQNILLKEVHHRVKNNLQVIASILDLQNISINDEKLNNVLEQGQNRIHSMALIHQQLYQNDNISEIHIASYIKTLINHITLSNNNSNIIFKVNTNGISFNINTAVPLGLILNELVTNIYKHAFDAFEKGSVSIEITKIKPHYFKLIISDNGKGLPKNFDILSNQSLGLKLVKILTHQLKGKITIKKNTTFIIEFRDDVSV